jgi:hypothetical protein
MITIKVPQWTAERIGAALETFAGAGQGIRYAYFYADRAVFTARPLKDTRGVLSRVSMDEVITDGDAVVERVRAEIRSALLRAARALEAESA